MGIEAIVAEVAVYVAAEIEADVRVSVDVISVAVNHL